MISNGILWLLVDILMGFYDIRLMLIKRLVIIRYHQVTNGLFNLDDN